MTKGNFERALESLKMRERRARGLRREAVLKMGNEDPTLKALVDKKNMLEVQIMQRSRVVNKAAECDVPKVPDYDKIIHEKVAGIRMSFNLAMTKEEKKLAEKKAEQLIVRGMKLWPTEEVK